MQIYFFYFAPPSLSLLSFCSSILCCTETASLKKRTVLNPSSPTLPNHASGNQAQIKGALASARRGLSKPGNQGPCELKLFNPEG